MHRLPAEWEPQSGVMLTWPHAETDWADQLDRVEALYADLAAMIMGYETLLIVCRDSAQAEQVRACVLAQRTEPARLRIAIAANNDTWARDHGPITVLGRDGAPTLLDFHFNGWGGKFAAELDTQITAQLHQSGLFGQIAREAIDLVLEGGAIETDGQGTLLAVKRTLVDPLRNPGLSRLEIEQKLAARLGIRHFLWLEHGAISGDDTDGHIDTLARFCDANTICHARCEDPSDADYAELKAMEEELQALRDIQGRPYRLVALPTPKPLLGADGERLPAGYANFLIINGAVILPIYGDPADAQAKAILADLFADREILTLDCTPLVRQGGSLHCITMQLPQGTLSAPH
ncbi:agmatine deiminase family protein [Thiorhodococcus mannitoliphagus]|uniref:Agmatine deiminase family protein n=1 Tax=Thiorhodococcus mannitoliphagus TaxID=329406 RepID=A0A6P1DPX3_9GAMM|nr:agmatine deiminase family protein [Thiorhodococcus mannitoliphagus]NEX19610.1 agmatine deiminase family protein [Thiorhodococcus mannitoliphagus]